MTLVDTHCHIHSEDYPVDIKEVYTSAKQLGVDKIICVGTDLEDSKLAIEFAANHDDTWASIGIHPHEANKYVDKPELLEEFARLATSKKVIAVGECGLDYFYNHSDKQSQKQLLIFQLELAKKHNLPLIFHVRNAFDDFWPILDNYPGIRGVLHSFTDDQANLELALNKNLMIGVNGISTFTKNPDQIKMYKDIPLASLVLETDAPYLTPAPFRGMICEPKHIKVIADFLVNLRGESSEELAKQTSNNVNLLFGV
jgi:TatD DNase family protein